jgi:hypothetical protein
MSQNRTFLSPKVMSGSPMGPRRCPMRASGEPDSRRLHAIRARLAIRAAETKEAIDNPQM